MFLLASNPAIQHEVKKNKNLIPQMLEEFKRFDPAVTFIFRVARADTQIGEQPISKGDVVFISTHLVNRDLPDSEQPFELDIHRKATHMAYGYGSHYCIGAKLARMEMVSLFEELLQELPLLTLSEEEVTERDHYSLSFSGFKALHLRANY
jgi:cytochrome P450